MIFGPELLINGSFSGNADGWTVGSGASYFSEKIKFSASSSSTCLVQTGLSLLSGHLYCLEFDVIVTAGSITPFGKYTSSLNFQFGNSVTSSGHYRYDSLPPLSQSAGVLSTDADRIFFNTVGFSGTIDNVSLREMFPDTGILTYRPTIITAVKRVEQNLPFPNFIIGGRTAGTETALFKKRDTYDYALWRSQVYQIGNNFDVLEITFPIHPDMTTNMSIIPILYFDNEDSNSVGTTINLTNYPVDLAGNGQRLIKLTSKNFGTNTNATHGKNNFFLELQFTGSVLAVVELPIEINLEVEEI